MSSAAGHGKLVKMCISLGIFLIQFAYSYILTLSGRWYAKGDEVLLSINLTGIGQLVKMLIAI